MGCPMVTGQAIDCRGAPYTYEAQGESPEYLEWVRQRKAGEDGPDTYEWKAGVPP